MKGGRGQEYDEKKKTIGIRAKIMCGAERINMIDYRSNTID
jgi:hypothetical protein